MSSTKIIQLVSLIFLGSIANLIQHCAVYRIDQAAILAGSK